MIATPPAATRGTSKTDQDAGFLTKQEIAKRFRTSERNITEWVRAKNMPHVKIGQLIRFHWPTVERWALAQSQAEKETAGA